MPGNEDNYFGGETSKEKTGFTGLPDSPYLGTGLHVLQAQQSDAGAF